MSPNPSVLVWQGLLDSLLWNVSDESPQMRLHYTIARSASGVSRLRKSIPPSSTSLVTQLIFCLPARIQSANILLITAKALANEVAKNLVLAGVGSLTIIDHEEVTEKDLGSQFLVREEHLGKNVS